LNDNHSYINNATTLVIRL